MISMVFYFRIKLQLIALCMCWQIGPLLSAKYGPHVEQHANVFVARYGAELSRLTRVSSTVVGRRRSSMQSSPSGLISGGDC